jgi:hypothetical protein
MATRETLNTCVGIAVNVGVETKKVVSKVRVGVDKYKRIKQSLSRTYTKIRGEYTENIRCDFIDLPYPMKRVDALRYALSAPEFQSPSDQSLISDQLSNLVPSSSTRKPRQVRVRAEPAAISLDSIRSRATKTPTLEIDALEVLRAADLVRE